MWAPRWLPQERTQLGAQTPVCCGTLGLGFLIRKWEDLAKRAQSPFQPNGGGFFDRTQPPTLPLPSLWGACSWARTTDASSLAPAPPPLQTKGLQVPRSLCRPLAETSDP